MPSTRHLLVVLTWLSASACGRTDPLWWSDIYASDSGTDEQGDGDGDPTIGTSTTDPTIDDTSTTDPDTSTSETSTSETSTSETSTTETTDQPCDPIVPGLSTVPAKVLLLLDQGAHMSLAFGGTTRWQAIGEALFSMQSGVVWSWEDDRELGMLSYTSFGGNQGGMCPVTELVAMATQNGAAMQLSFAGLIPEVDNPTPDAVDLAVAQFGGEPGVLVVLQGRNPDRCANPSNNGAAANATIAAVQAAYQQGISSYLVQVGDINPGFAQQLANAGVGLDPQGVELAPWSTPQDVASLAQSLDLVLAGAVRCELDLDLDIPPGAEATCSFELDGMLLGLDDPDGWSLVGANRVRLSGAACQSFIQGAQPSLVCDCDGFAP